MSAPPPNLTFYHTIEYAPGRRTEGWPVIVPIVDMIRAAMQRVLGYWDGRSETPKLADWTGKRG